MKNPLDPRYGSETQGNRPEIAHSETTEVLACRRDDSPSDIGLVGDGLPGEGELGDGRSAVGPPVRRGEGLTRRSALAAIGSGLVGLGIVPFGARRASAHSPNKFYQGALPYDFTALKGFLSQESLESHYRFHHRPQVDRANELLELLAKARAEKTFDLIPGYSDELTRAISGHVLHSLFWHSVSPYTAGDPTGDVATHIVDHFGSTDAFRSQLRSMARAVSESGWTTLVWEPNSSRLLVVNIEGDAGPFLLGSAPLLALDLHEHAYYPDYGHRRDDYIDKFLEMIDWDFLAVQLKRVH
ncbi:MAG: superoxide dismutase [Candidatus Eisenbacteria bacterium]|uniref:superoxide dismutase n=1 Tax=Eiseniibacteriota bacterium TaxID=2212470 RepID=A0A956SF79_UNCEI|nr:superoxide dismutase [Candidatus Eisenbacteria bacterium]